MEYTETEVRAMLKKHANVTGSQKVLAFKLNCSQPYLSDVINGQREIGPKILRELNLERITTTVYRKAERLAELS